MGFIIIWLPVFIITILLLYPRGLVRDRENYIRYKNNGILFLIFSMVLFGSLATSFFMADTSAQAQVNSYGGAAVIGTWIVFIAPFLFIISFSFLLRGVKFLVEAREIKKMV